MVRLIDSVRIDGTGEVTTIAALADAGRVRFTTGEHDGPKRLGERRRVRHYHAELIPEMNGGAEGFWPISATAYASRTRQAAMGAAFDPTEE